MIDGDRLVVHQLRHVT